MPPRYIDIETRLVGKSLSSSADVIKRRRDTHGIRSVSLRMALVLHCLRPFHTHLNYVRLQQHSADGGENGDQTGHSEYGAVQRGNATRAGVVCRVGAAVLAVGGSSRRASTGASGLVLTVTGVLRARAVQTRTVTGTLAQVLIESQYVANVDRSE